MTQFFRKPVYVFFALSILLLAVFCLLPINIFDGEVVKTKGLVSFTQSRPLSLYFVLGLEYSQNELKNNLFEGYFIKDYYLLPKGIAMAFIFTIGIPALVAYRIFLGNKQKSEK